MSELVSNGVQIYQFPLDDETVAKVNTSMNVRICTSQFTRIQEFMKRVFKYSVVNLLNIDSTELGSHELKFRVKCEFLLGYKKK